VLILNAQYAILMASVLNSIAKYSISVIDLRRASRRGGENAPPWEDKSMWVFYVELATGTCFADPAGDLKF
jgi:E3 ubiquitin-protein ligase synoviolin